MKKLKKRKIQNYDLIFNQMLDDIKTIKRYIYENNIRCVLR